MFCSNSKTETQETARLARPVQLQEGRRPRGGLKRPGPVPASPFLSGSAVLNLTRRPLSEPRGPGHGCTHAHAHTHAARPALGTRPRPVSPQPCRAAGAARTPLGPVGTWFCPRAVSSWRQIRLILLQLEIVRLRLRERHLVPHGARARPCGAPLRLRVRLPGLRAPPPASPRPAPDRSSRQREQTAGDCTARQDAASTRAFPTPRAARVQNKGLRRRSPRSRSPAQADPPLTRGEAGRRRSWVGPPRAHPFSRGRRQ